MILAGKLQFYQLQKRKTKKNSGSDGIWTQASQNITTNWATEVNVNSSALMPIRTLHSSLIFASVILVIVLQMFFLSAYNKTFRNILLWKRRLKRVPVVRWKSKIFADTHLSNGIRWGPWESNGVFQALVTSNLVLQALKQKYALNRNMKYSIREICLVLKALKQNSPF